MISRKRASERFESVYARCGLKWCLECGEMKISVNMDFCSGCEQKIVGRILKSGGMIRTSKEVCQQILDDRKLEIEESWNEVKGV